MNRHTQKHKSPYTRGGSTLLCAYSCTLFALICAFLLPSPAVATPSPDPATIRALAADAYVWGLGLETVYRLSKYNTIIGAPYNTLKYGAVPAAWNNEATNAGDASVVYVNGFVNFDVSHELVFTVPSTTLTYYVAAYYDAYGNDVGSFGTRTTPSDTATSYLLVGPTSPFAHMKTAKIQGYTYPVMASDTDLNWFLIRVRANTLIDSSDPTSVPNIVNNVVHGFALNTLHEFEQNGHQPVYPASFFLPPPTQEQQNEAEPYQNTPTCPVDPTCAVDFFTQLGTAVASNPIPNANTGLSGTLVGDLPSWVLPQYGATSPSSVYFVPSYGQQDKFDSFAPIGLKKNGFRVPNNWTQEQLDALYAGYSDGQKILQDFIHLAGSDECTNYWGIVNDFVGTYPNNAVGYLYRSLSAVEGGVSNYPLDAVYPTMLNLPSSDNSLKPLDGNNTYMVTFTLPPSSPIPGPCTPSGSPWPVSGILPPMYPNSDNPAGFWSIHVYAQDKTQAAAPFIAQTSLQNLYYSTEYTPVLSVRPAPTNTITVTNPTWGNIVSSTPIRFGDNAADYGLMPNTVYYAVCSEDSCPNSDQTTSTFSVSTQWRQQLSTDSPPVPIQGPGGSPGPIVTLPSPSPGASPLQYAMVKPVTQLGSTQLAAGQLYINPNNSVTLWFGPSLASLPPGAPASNWIPTPNTAYYQPIYNQQISTVFQLTLRMYYPNEGPPPSILPCTGCSPPVHESYIPPAVECVSGPTCP